MIKMIKSMVENIHEVFEKEKDPLEESGFGNSKHMEVSRGFMICG